MTAGYQGPEGGGRGRRTWDPRPRSCCGPGFLGSADGAGAREPASPTDNASLLMPVSSQGRRAVSAFPGSPTPPRSPVSAHQPPCRSKKGCRVPAPRSCGRSVPVLVSGGWQCHADQPTLPLPWGRAEPLHPGLLAPGSQDLGRVHAPVPHSSRGKACWAFFRTWVRGAGLGDPVAFLSLKCLPPLLGALLKRPLFSQHTRRLL